MKLDGRVALVTGSGRGIGRASALRLAALGADVVITDIDLDSAHRVDEAGPGNSVVNEVRALGRRSVGIEADATRQDAVEQMVRQVIDVFGRLDILVNNVGGGQEAGGGHLRGASHGVTREAFQRAIASTRAARLFCQAERERRAARERTGFLPARASSPLSSTTWRNTCENRADSDAMITSQASAMLQPIPATAPRTAATTGFSMFARLRTMRCASLSSSRPEAGVNSPILLTSPLAQNALPLACNSTARTAGSRAALSNALPSASRISTVSAFNFSGRSSVTIPTAPRTSQRAFMVRPFALQKGS